MKSTIIAAAAILLALHLSAQPWTGSTTSVTTTRTGNTLIGGTSIHGSYGSSTRVLQVQGTESVFGLRANSNTAIVDMFLGATWFTVNAVNIPINLSTNYATRIHITTGGNVGIGTATPGSFRLAVEGKVGAREVVVTTAPWADYVFKPGYRLRPLAEVEKFISENNHLPDVPSEEDIAREGHNLGQMDATLLRKVEELTLYIIELKKEIELLKSEE